MARGKSGKLIETCEAPEYLDPAGVEPWPGNPRRIDGPRKARLRASLLRLGMYKPFVVWRDEEGVDRALTGNQRLALARELVAEGWTLAGGGLPAVRFAGSRALADKIVLRDNRQDGDWDYALLRGFLEDLPADDYSGVAELRAFLGLVPAPRPGRLGKVVKVAFDLTREEYEEVTSAAQTSGLDVARAAYEALVRWSEAAAGEGGAEA